jgi:ferredoxin
MGKDTLMLRKIVLIDEEKCNGCGDCVPSCAEGAIKIINGKAKLTNDSLCDGIGNCLGYCPQGAITIVEREAAPFDEALASQHTVSSKAEAKPEPVAYPACPGSLARMLKAENSNARPLPDTPRKSRLENWPVQLKLVPPSAPYLKGASLLICADCVPFALADFHERYLDGRILMVGCPKLDDLEFYFDKLKAIFSTAQPKDITVIRMEVPCCYGIVRAVEEARDIAAPGTPLETVTISVNGEIVT